VVTELRPNPKAEIPRVPVLRRLTVVVMAVATGAAVANNYFAQPLLPLIGQDLHLSSGTTGLIVTFAQLGFAAGLLLIVPLGDLVERRALIVGLSLASAAGLVGFALSGSGALVLAAAAFVGVVTVLVQIIVAFAASLAGDADRGRIVGMVMSGLLIGILLARTVAGVLAELGSWRTVYLVGAAIMVAEAGGRRTQLPLWHESTGLRYRAALASTARLFTQEPLIRLRAAFGLLCFATFSVLWTSMAYLLADHYRYGPAVIGLFGIAGAAGALTATAAGRRSDQGKLRSSTLVSCVVLSASWLMLWLGGQSIIAFIVGVILLDIGAQALHITNQGAIYRIHPEARSRVTSVYMICYFLGGAAGSALSTSVFQRWGWNGVSALGAAFALAATALAIVAVTTDLRRVEDVAALPVSRAP